MTLKVTQNTITVFEGKTDICDKKKRMDMVKLPLHGFGVPNRCPITSNFTFCRNDEKVFTFSESSKKLISAFAIVAKRSVIKVMITHDTGKSCFEVDSEIVKV